MQTADSLHTLGVVQCVQSKYKAVRFSCKQRGPLLSALYQCMALAAADNLCPVAAKILGCGVPTSQVCSWWHWVTRCR